MDEDVFFTPDHQTSSWIIDDFTCRIQSSDPKIAEQIARWAFAKLMGRCVVGPTRIFSIPRRKWRLALRILGIELPSKNPNRQTAGVEVGSQNMKRWREGLGQKNLLPLRRTILGEPMAEATPISITAYKAKSIRKIEGR